MKKLLITTMAAVSVGLCAKAADDGFISGTSFETVPEKSYLATNGETTLCNWYGEAGSVLSDDYSTDPELRGRYWMTEATDAQLVVSNVTNFAGDYLSTDNRPQQWRDGDNTKALYIDTDKPLMRYVNPSTDGGTAAGADLDQDIFFDSVVQFTATDVAAQPDTADKLRVWLYTSPDDVGTTPGLFSETTPKTCLVVTAGKYDGELSTSNLKAEHYEVQIEGVELQPDTWHRLTIKAIADIDPTESATPGFEIWVDGKPVTYGADKKTQFPSLKEAVPSGKETLQCVAFDGKGAVDDIVFTTTDPFYVAPEVAETFALNVSISAADEADALLLAVKTNNVSVTAVNGSYTLELGTGDVKAYVECLSGYKVSDSQANYDADNGYWIVPIDVSGATADGTLNVTITVEEAGGGSGEEPEDPEDPAKPTIGGAAVETAEAFIAAANSGATIKVPTGWTLDGNTLKDADGKEYATFADYYTATLATDGTVTLELNDNAEPTIDETAADKGDAIVVTDAAVALGVTNAKEGLWYGAQAYSDAACTTKIGDEPTGWEQAKGTTVTVTATKPEADKAFFKVVVTDIAPKSTEE